MAVTIGAGGLQDGGAVVETSGGVKYAVFFETTANYVEIYKNIDGTPSRVGHELWSAIHGDQNVGWVHAALDSNDKIHVVCAALVDATRDIAYRVFATSTDSWEGSWVEAAEYTTQAPVNPGCSTTICSNDYPHILFVDAVKAQGSTQDNVYYTYNDGSWATPEQVGARATKTDSYNSPNITACPADDMEAFYYFVTDGDPAYRRRNGTWNSESVYTETLAVPFDVVCTTGDTTYRYHVIAGGAIEENNVSTGYDWGPILGSAALDGTTRYVFYADNDYDTHAISNDGGGW